MSNEKFLIGDIAKLLDLSSETLRHYERQGLITPTYKDENGYRMFTSKDYSFLFFTKYLRALDFSLTDIKDFLDESDPIEQIEMLEEQAANIKEEIMQLNYKLNKIKELEQTIKHYKDNLNKFDMVKMNSFWFVPVRKGEKLCVSKDDIKDNKAMIRQILDVTFTMIADVKYDGKNIDTDRVFGLSVDGNLPKPAENAEYYTGGTAIRLLYKINPSASSFNDMLKLMGVIDKLNDLGFDPNRRVIGVMLNQSNGELGPTGDYCLYIPVTVDAQSASSL